MNIKAYLFWNPPRLWFSPACVGAVIGWSLAWMNGILVPRNSASPIAIFCREMERRIIENELIDYCRMAEDRLAHGNLWEEEK